MFDFFDQYDEITVYSSPTGSISFSTQRQLHAISHSGRDIQGDHFFGKLNTFSVTMGTFLIDYLAFSFTSGTSRCRLHGTQDGILYPGDLSGTMTSGTGGKRVTVFCSGTVAVGISNIFLYFDFLFYACSHFLQSHLHFHSQVGSPIHPSG